MTDAAEWLGVTRQTLHAVMRAENPARISADMAVRLAQAFDTSPDMWARMQAAWDVWHALQSQKGRAVSRYPAKAERTARREAVASK